MILRYLPDIIDGTHGGVRRHGGIEHHQHQRGISVLQRFLILGGKDICRNRDIEEGSVPEHLLYVLHLLYISGHFLDVLILHPLDHHHGEGTGTEILGQDILSLHGFDLLGKIGQDIVVGTGIQIPEHGRDQQQYRYDQDRDPQLYHCVSKTFVQKKHLQSSFVTSP